MIKVLVSSKIKDIYYEVGSHAVIGNNTLVVKRIDLVNHWDANGYRNGEIYIVKFVGGYTLSLPFNDYGILYKEDDEAE